MGEAGFLCGAELTDDEISLEDELAEKAVRYVLHLARNHVRRFAWIFGYPHSKVLLCGTAKESDKFITDFTRHREQFRKLQDLEVTTPVQELMVQRSPFKVFATEQISRGVDELPGSRADLVDMANKHTTAAHVSTHFLEKFNNIGKTVPMKSLGGRFRRPQTGLCASIRKHLAVEAGLTPLPTEVPGKHRVEPLTKADLTPTLDPIMNFAVVKLGGQTAPYPQHQRRELGEASWGLVLH